MKLEVCIDQIESARIAVAGGADRLEVCGALAVGGITPSQGLVEQCVELVGREVMMMIRPHAGGFQYSAGDLDTILRDIQVARSCGVRGIVFGALRDGKIDREVTRRVIDAARPLEITFHRAFDLVADPREAFDELLGLGIDRLLTSGQEVTAIDGAPLIAELVRRAGDRLIVVAGGGVRPPHVAQLIQETGVREIHSRATGDRDPSTSSPGSFVHEASVTCLETVRSLAAALRARSADNKSAC